MHHYHGQTERAPIFDHHRQSEQQFTEDIELRNNCLDVLEIIHEFEAVEMIVD